MGSCAQEPVVISWDLVALATTSWTLTDVITNGDVLLWFYSGNILSTETDEQRHTLSVETFIYVKPLSLR